MDTNEMRYCLAKQLARAHTVQTDYGDFALDDEMREVVENALRPIIERRLDPACPVRPLDSGGGHWVGPFTRERSDRVTILISSALHAARAKRQTFRRLLYFLVSR